MCVEGKPKILDFDYFVYWFGSKVIKGVPMWIIIGSDNIYNIEVHRSRTKNPKSILCNRWVEPCEKREIGYEHNFLADNGSWVSVLSGPDKCQIGTLELFKKFKVKVYAGVKFEICVNCVKSIYQYIFLVSHGFRKYIFLLTSKVSVLSY